MEKQTDSEVRFRRLITDRRLPSPREIHPARQFRQWVLKERDRSDQSQLPFSLILFSSSSILSAQDANTLICCIEPILSTTDEFGVVDESTLGLLLPDTEADQACQIAAEIHQQLDSTQSRALIVDVYTYPDASDSEADLVTTASDVRDEFRIHSDSSRRTTGSRTHLLEARNLSFAKPMPWWKRGIDLFASVMTLTLMSPILLFIAIMIKLTSRGPVFFMQWREGKGGKKFRIYKFRTMVENAETIQRELRHLSEQDGPAFKMENDPRLTWFGALLRKSCLDEIPQFINILRGEMTLVGPRPLPVNESMACSQWQRRRLDVTPGMTCTWQIHNDRNISFEEWMRMDEEYIRNISFLQDLKIVVKTAFFVLIRRASV